MNIAIVKYNAGNIQSLTFALNRLGITPKVTDDPEELRAADKVIFPGQGEASSAMNYLRARKLDQVLVDLHQPFLGICLGMQLMCKHLEEGDTPGLGLIDATVRKFSTDHKVPHMGWNDISKTQGALMQDIEAGSFLYFVHSYYVEECPHTVATCDYGVPFSAAVQKDNYYAIQPHPEKSAESGLKILSNFINL
ncbi:MAG: imidazole glycerol phosphate synthase subunit HisH [Cytophagales bacterium]|nr:imidazole glycerol phosphate synthase subunit HisH [Cytophagales bacterium]